MFNYESLSLFFLGGKEFFVTMEKMQILLFCEFLKVCQIVNGISQCFGFLFIESGSGKKSESGYGQNLNRDQSCFLTLPGINIKLFFKNMLMSSSYDPASGSRRPLNPDPKP